MQNNDMAGTCHFGTSLRHIKLLKMGEGEGGQTIPIRFIIEVNYLQPI